MATVNDIDVKAVVNRFLQRQVITPAKNDEADKDEEVTAVLESVALSFQLQPQIGLSMLMLAKNSLRQVVQSDLDLVAFLISAIRDIDNPTTQVADLSDLIEAQTALVELDRLQRVATGLQAFQRYKKSVDRFLDNQLATSLKRKAQKEFERSGQEARSDIFNILPQFGPTHSVMASRLATLANGIDDFRSVALDRLVSQRTLGRVRDSLQAIKSRFENDAISKTTAAVELLGGTASMEAVSTTSDIVDPVVQTGVHPSNRLIYASAEPAVAATVLSSAGPWTLGATPWDFQMTLNALSTNPIAVDVELPASGLEGTVYLVSSDAAAGVTFNIPTNGTLYIRAVGSAAEEQEVLLTTFGSAVPIATVISELNAGLTEVTAALWGTNRIVLYGDVGVVTQLVIHGASPGFFVTTDPIPDPYDPYNTSPSIHDAVGFALNQSSLPLGVFTAEALQDALALRVTSASFAVEGDALRITSNLAHTQFSSVQFDGGVDADFGFTGLNESSPGYLVLIENEQEVAPTASGVYVGSLVTTTESLVTGSSRRALNNEAIESIEGTKLFFSASILPRSAQMNVTIEAPIVCAAEELRSKLKPLVGTFDSDFAALRQKMSPIISNPTKAQINDALRLMRDIKTRLEAVRDVLDSITIRDDRSQFRGAANKILSALEGRGLDRARDLLAMGDFSAFFGLTKATASRANRFMTSMAATVNTDMPLSIIESDIEDDVRVVASSSDENALPSKEPSSRDESNVTELS